MAKQEARRLGFPEAEPNTFIYVRMKKEEANLINEILGQHPDTVVQIRLADLDRFGKKLVNDVHAEFVRQQEAMKSAETETYLTPEHAEAMLDVSSSTLYRLRKANVIDSVLIGGRRRFKLSTIKKYIENGN